MSPRLTLCIVGKMRHLRVLPAVTASLLIAACGKADAPLSPTPSTIAAGTWSVRRVGDVLEVGYGSGSSYPQYAALHLGSGYLRLVYPGGAWATSVVLLPSFWTQGTYFQGAPVSTTLSAAGADVDIGYNATIGGLAVSGHVRLSPPAQDSIAASVSVAVTGTVALDPRPGEAFKPVMLSSMHLSTTVWDAVAGFVDDCPLDIPADGWMFQPPVSAQRFGLRGGSSAWKASAPTVEIRVDRSLSVTGWVTPSTNPNDDNVALWCASSQMLPNWNYDIRAYRQ